MTTRLATAAPLLWISRGVERAAYLFRAWRTYCRIKVLFPNAKGLSFSLSTSFKHIENISIGDHVMIGPHATIGAHAPVTLADHVRISQGVLIETAGLDLSQQVPYPHVSKPIVLHRGAWVGAGATILGGVTVGEYAVIGAGAIVTRDVPPHAIMVGASARMIDGRLAGRHHLATKAACRTQAE